MPTFITVTEILPRQGDLGGDTRIRRINTDHIVAVFNADRPEALAEIVEVTGNRFICTESAEGVEAMLMEAGVEIVWMSEA